MGLISLVLLILKCACSYINMYCSAGSGGIHVYICMYQIYMYRSHNKL